MYPHTLMWGNSPSTTSPQVYLTYLLNPPNFHFCGQDNITRGTAQRVSPHSSPQPANPETCHPSPTSYIYPAKVTAIPRRAIPRHFTLMEKHFPSIVRNIFSVHSHCSSLAIVTMGEGVWGVLNRRNIVYYTRKKPGGRGGVGGCQGWLKRKRRLMTTMAHYGRVRTKQQGGYDGSQRKWAWRWQRQQRRW